MFERKEYILRYKKTIHCMGLTLLVLCILINSVLSGPFIITRLIDNLTDTPILASFWKYLITNIIGYLFTFMFPVLLFRMLMKNQPQVGYRLPRVQAHISCWTPLVAIFVIGLTIGFAWVNHWIYRFTFGWIGNGIQQTTTSAGRTPLELMMRVIGIGFVPGFVEELLFRGTICEHLLQYNPKSAVFISALLFSLMHQNFQQFFYTFMAGILFGWLYLKTKSIWLGVIAHTANNFVSVMHDQLDAIVDADFVLWLGIACWVIWGVCTIILAIRFILPILRKNSTDERATNAWSLIWRFDEPVRCPISTRHAWGTVLKNRLMIAFLCVCLLSALLRVAIIL